MTKICLDCCRTYDDAECWTICPHRPLSHSSNRFCPKCDIAWYEDSDKCPCCGESWEEIRTREANHRMLRMIAAKAAQIQGCLDDPRYMTPTRRKKYERELRACHKTVSRLETELKA